jgi:hypothetical protein
LQWHLQFFLAYIEACIFLTYSFSSVQVLHLCFPLQITTTITILPPPAAALDISLNKYKYFLQFLQQIKSFSTFSKQDKVILIISTFSATTKYIYSELHYSYN